MVKMTSCKLLVGSHPQTSWRSVAPPEFEVPLPSLGLCTLKVWDLGSTFTQWLPCSYNFSRSSSFFLPVAWLSIRIIFFLSFPWDIVGRWGQIFFLFTSHDDDIILQGFSLQGAVSAKYFLLGQDWGFNFCLLLQNIKYPKIKMGTMQCLKDFKKSFLKRDFQLSLNFYLVLPHYLACKLNYLKNN